MIASSQTSLGSQKPRWSFKTLFISFLLIVGFSTTVVLLVSHNELWLELEMVLGIISVVIFHFYWWVLYHGVEFVDDEHFKLSFAPLEVSDAGKAPGDVASSGSKDLVEFLILSPDLAVFFLLAIGLSFLSLFGINSFLLAIALIAAPLFYIFRTSIKFVLKNTPKCHGSLLQAALYSAFFTLLKTLCVGFVIAGAHYLILMYKGG